MIASLQRLLFLTWTTTCFGTLLAASVSYLEPALTILFIAALIGGHALVLGAEFAWMHRANRDDPTERARTGQVLKAWMSEVLYAPQVFFWRQPWGHQKWPDTSHASGSGRWPRGLVLVHGYFCNRGLWNPWLKRCREEGIPFIAVTLEPAFGSIDAYATAVDEAVAKITRDTGAPPVVVAHSMGGLAVRRWWSAQCPAKLHRLITLGTPHQGTQLARFGATINARQMREDSAWLQHLNALEAEANRANTLCVYSHCDNIVFPAARARLAGAQVLHLPATPHVAMVDHPEVWRVACESLRT